MTDRAGGRRRRLFGADVEIVAASSTGCLSLYDDRQHCAKQRKQAFLSRNVDLKGNHIVSRSSYFGDSSLYTSNIHDLFESRFARPDLPGWLQRREIFREQSEHRWLSTRKPGGR
jgi:hypothetical protein